MGLNQSEDRFNGVIASLAIKAPCKTVTDGVGNILLEGEQTINAIAVVVDDRVLVMEQTDPVENGIYNVRTSTWERSADWDGNRDVVKGTLVTVNRPPNNLTCYVQVNLGVGQDEPTIDTDPVNFSIFFTQTSSLDDLDDVDLTGCTDDDLMYWSGGVLVCTLGDLTWDGLDLTINGNLEMPVLGAPRLINANGSIAAPNVLFNNLDDDSGVVTSLDSMWHVVGGFTAVNYRERSDHVIVTSEAHVGLTASTTQTQAGALELLSTYNQITTVANSGDAVRLPTAFQTLNQGRRMLIINDGAESMQMFPTTDQDIGAGQDQPLDLAAGQSAYFLAVSNSIPSVNWRQIFVASASGSVGSLAPLRGCKAYKTAGFAWPRNDLPGFTIPDNAPGGTSVVIDFNAEVFDTDSIHDNVTNNSRFTIPSGITQVEMIVGYMLDSLGTAQAGLGHVYLRKNGIQRGVVDTIMPSRWPWNSDNNGGGTNDVGGGTTGEAGMIGWYSGVINITDSDYLEVLVLSQAGSRDTPANGIWAEMRLLA